MIRMKLQEAAPVQDLMQMVAPEGPGVEPQAVEAPRDVLVASPEVAAQPIEDLKPVIDRRLVDDVPAGDYRCGGFSVDVRADELTIKASQEGGTTTTKLGSAFALVLTEPGGNSIRVIAVLERPVLETEPVVNEPIVDQKQVEEEAANAS